MSFQGHMYDKLLLLSFLTQEIFTWHHRGDILLGGSGLNRHVDWALALPGAGLKKQIETRSKPKTKQKKKIEET